MVARSSSTQKGRFKINGEQALYFDKISEKREIFRLFPGHKEAENLLQLYP
jgi:hypothetical protein